MQEWAAYIDESGNRGGVEGGSDYFVVAGVVGGPAALDELAGRIRRLKLELVPHADPADWELHAREMFHDHSGSFLGSMSTEEKMSVMRKMVDIVCGCDVVPLGAAVSNKKMRKGGSSAARITEHAMVLPVELLERLAQGMGDGTALKVVSDTTHKKYRLAMERALSQRVTGRVRLPPGGERRVTRIEFVGSRSSALVQVADAIAYIIHRHVRGDAMFGELFGDIRRKSRLPQGQGGMRIRSGRRVG